MCPASNNRVILKSITAASKCSSEILPLLHGQAGGGVNSKGRREYAFMEAAIRSRKAQVAKSCRPSGVEYRNLPATFKVS